MKFHQIWPVVFCLFGVPSVLSANHPLDDTERPNLIFLMADDQCTYSMGCYGTPHAKTPNLDKLASDGITFDRHYVSTAICMGSRANVVTGTFEFKHSCNFNRGPLIEEDWNQSYPLLLRRAGYSTGFAGKIGFEIGKSVSVPNQGSNTYLPSEDFDQWGGGPGQTSYQTAKNQSMKKYASAHPHSTTAYGAFGVDFIRKFSNKKKPFCLSISFKAPHRPVQPDPQFNRIYHGIQFVKPRNFGRQNGSHFSQQSRQGRQFERFHTWEYSSSYDEVMAKYYQQIYAIDVAVGMIRKEVIRQKIEKNTVFIYTSDNGFFCGSHGYGSKVLPYEESSRVPLIIYDPRHPNSHKQIRCRSLSGNVDFAPTLLSLAGVQIPEKMDGRNLMPLYDDPKSSIRKSLPLINVWGPQETYSLAVVTKEGKYINWPYAKNNFSRTEEFYNISDDPFELENRISNPDSAKTVNQLRQFYDQYVKQWREESIPGRGYSSLAGFFSR